MQRTEPTEAARLRRSSWLVLPVLSRDRFALLSALVAVVMTGTVIGFTRGTTFFMPGPLSSAHGAIENCSGCHARSGNTKLSWVHGLVAGDPHADSKACLTCHALPATALNAHGATAAVLRRSTERMSKMIVTPTVPQSALAQSIAFPTHDIMGRGVACATCHQEHQGASFDLSKFTNEQCRSCHTLKFDGFDGHHPQFDGYPFRRRSRIVYDHAGHFGKHFPDVAKKDPTRTIPATCSACHDTRGDKRIMGVAPFEQTCATCHRDQISGKERVSGPKGIAFLSLPGLDLETMKKKKAAIGEWPAESEAALTPFMKVMIGRNDRGRDLLRTVENLSLHDLSSASDDQIKAVTELVWETKQTLFKLISGKASDTLGDLGSGGGAKFEANRIASLTASIPRDVILTAQRQWLPNLAAEIAEGPGAIVRQQNGWSTVTTQGDEPQQAAARETDAAPTPDPDAGTDAITQSATNNPKSEADARPAKRDPPACVVRILGQCIVSKSEDEKADVIAEGETQQPESRSASPVKVEKSRLLPGPMRAGLKDAGQTRDVERGSKQSEIAEVAPSGGLGAANAGSTDARPPVKQPTGKVAGQNDELLFPTETELREIKARNKNFSTPSSRKSSGEAATVRPAALAGPRAQTSDAANLTSEVDAESWAEYGGWYQKDYAIFYRPADHKDAFIRSWLALTGPQAPAGDKGPAAAVFEYLSAKDAQGSCTKCHSVDDVEGRGRVVNFSPSSVSVAGKHDQFTRFNHQPHFGITGDRGCLTCHTIEKGRPYLKSYEQRNPRDFTSEFSAIKKDSCQACHNSTAARQDCLLCHKYHLTEPFTPITTTKLPP